MHILSFRSVLPSVLLAVAATSGCGFDSPGANAEPPTPHSPLAGAKADDVRHPPCQESDEIVRVEVRDQESVYALTIPAGTNDVALWLNADVDVDFRVYDADGTQVVGWPDGILAARDEISGEYDGVTFLWSGFGGDGTGSGNEPLTISGRTRSDFRIEVFGYEAGPATVRYRRGCEATRWEASDEAVVCDGGYWTPTIAAGGDRFAVGCVRVGNQNVTPELKIVDALGSMVAEKSLLTSDGYYYTDIQVTAHQGRFQAVYQYNCDDNGSWGVGWGWGCVDFREYGHDGQVRVNSTVFGETGHNGHPVLDWNGNGFGVAWVSYDDMYFRALTRFGELVGGDRLDNKLIGSDPAQSDDRDDARTKIAWNQVRGEWGVFSILGDVLYFVRVNGSGAPQGQMKSLGTAYSQTFGGQFVVLNAAGDYFVLYYDKRDLRLTRLSGATGSVVTTRTVQAGEYRYPSMFIKDGLLYLFIQEAETNLGKVAVFDLELEPVESKSGLIGIEGLTMYHPQAAYDDRTGRIGVVYLDAIHRGRVLFRTLTEPN